MTVQPVEEMVLRLEELLFPSIANVAVLSADVDDETVRIEARSAVAGAPSVRTADRAPAVDAGRGRPRARRSGRGPNGARLRCVRQPQHRAAAGRSVARPRRQDAPTSRFTSSGTGASPP